MALMNLFASMFLEVKTTGLLRAMLMAVCIVGRVPGVGYVYQWESN